jgi:hypothetical protein
MNRGRNHALRPGRRLGAIVRLGALLAAGGAMTGSMRVQEKAARWHASEGNPCDSPDSGMLTRHSEPQLRRHGAAVWGYTSRLLDPNRFESHVLVLE